MVVGEAPGAREDELGRPFVGQSGDLLTMGVVEMPKFAQGTVAMGKLLAGLKATTVIGGGSTSEAVTNMGLADKMTFVSTGGGASLSFVSGEKLPGVEVLLDKKD